MSPISTIALECHKHCYVELVGRSARGTILDVMPIMYKIRTKMECPTLFLSLRGLPLYS